MEYTEDAKMNLSKPGNACINCRAHPGSGGCSLDVTSNRKLTTKQQRAMAKREELATLQAEAREMEKRAAETGNWTQSTNPNSMPDRFNFGKPPPPPPSSGLMAKEFLV